MPLIQTREQSRRNQLRVQEAAAELPKKATGYVGDLRDLGYTKLSDVRTAGTYRVYNDPAFLTDYPAILSRDGLNYALLHVDVGDTYVIQKMTVGDASGSMQAEAYCFINTSNSFISNWWRNAAAAPPTEYNLPLTEGYSYLDHKNVFYKTQEGIVHIEMCVYKLEGTYTVDDCFAILPEGYRPKTFTFASATGDGVYLGSGLCAAEVLVSPTGEIYPAGGNINAHWIVAQVSYVAA